METWKAIPGFEGQYEISDQGRCKNVGSGPGIVTGHILKPLRTIHGYTQYRLGKYEKPKTIHSLVLLAFVGQRPIDFDINHKNGVKDDNRLENLEYVSKSDNCIHMTHVLGKRRGESHGNAKLTDDAVREIRRLYATGLSQYKIATRFQITRPNVGYIVRRIAWSHIE